MKKIKYLLLFLFTISTSFSKTYILDELIKKVEINGNEAKYQELDKTKIKINEKKVEKIDENGIDLNIKPSVIKNIKTGSEIGNSSIEANYNIFTLGAEDDTGPWVGVNKNLNDYIYSEKDYQTNIFRYNKKKIMNESQLRTNKEILNLIDTVLKYIDETNTFDFLKKEEKQYKKEYESIKEKYKLNSSSQLDLERSKVNYLNLLNNIENSKANLNNLLLDLNQLFYLNVSSDDTVIFCKDNIDSFSLDDINSMEIQNFELDRKIVKEDLKYSKFKNDYPKFDFNSKYNVNSKDWTISLEITKKLFDYDDESEINYTKLKEKEERKKDFLISTRSKKRSINQEISRLNAIVENNFRDSNLKNMEYLIFQKKYELGSENLSNYSEKREDYEKSYLEYKKSKNKLQSYTYKIEYMN